VYATQLYMSSSQRSRRSLLASAALIGATSCDEYTCQDLANCAYPSPSGSDDAAVAPRGDDGGVIDSIELASTEPTRETSASTNVDSAKSGSAGIATTGDHTSSPDRSDTNEERERPADAGLDSSVPTCSEVCVADAARCADGSPEICQADANGCASWVAHAVCTACAAPAAVAALSPMRGAYTGSLHAESERATLRPTLTWTDSSADCGEVVYQVQLDDSCAPGALEACEFDSPEVDVGVSEVTYQPTEDLPVRREVPVGALYAWRVRACAWETECSDWSSVAYLHVGRTEQDVNGDGYADMLLAGTVSSASVIELYAGGPNFNAARDRRIELDYPISKVPRFVGDVNGDGFADLAVAEQATELCSSTGMNVGVVYGAADGAALTSDHLCRTQGTSSVMLGFAHGGDLNGDGFADIVVAHDFANTENRVYVLEGGAPVASTPSVDMEAGNGAPYPHTETAGVALAGGGDFNGDSFADVLLSASGVSEEVLTTRLYLGASSLPEEFADDQQYEGCSNNTWNALLQDINDDGKADWGTTCSGSAGSQFGVMLGGQALPAAKSNVFTSDIALTSASPAFDFDDNGDVEVFIGRSEEDSLIWRREGFNPSAPEAFSDISYQATVTTADHDGDGRMDIGAFSSAKNARWAGSYSSFNVTPVPLTVASDVELTHMVF
jgi:hypothetical protein